MEFRRDARWARFILAVSQGREGGILGSWRRAKECDRPHPAGGHDRLNAASSLQPHRGSSCQAKADGRSGGGPGRRCSGRFSLPFPAASPNGWTRAISWRNDVRYGLAGVPSGPRDGRAGRCKGRSEPPGRGRVGGNDTCCRSRGDCSHAATSSSGYGKDQVDLLDGGVHADKHRAFR